ncbi:MAG: radical SAM protein [Archaeoglobaceae archaeon]|nr:radical SAM protein [Archaeoglobaceae archaeon]
MKHKIDTLIVETVGFCNLKCIMCPTRNYATGKVLISDEIFKKVIEIVKKHDIKIIDMTGWGEPLLDSKLEERIAKIKELKKHMTIGFTTNGTLLTKKRIERILEAVLLGGL